jgi:hypothetical protein
MKESKPRIIRLPGFLIEEERGLGDLIKETTYRFGIRPCTSCEKRAEALNQFIAFAPKITHKKP